MTEYENMCFISVLIIIILLFIIYKLKTNCLISDGIIFKKELGECIDTCMNSTQTLPPNDTFTMLLYKSGKIVVYDKIDSTS